MSPPPPSTLGPDDISPEVKQAGIAGLLGMMGMAVKIILTDDKLKVGKVMANLFAAMAVAVLSGFALEEYIQNKKMLWALNGLSGYMALQIIAWAESAVKARLAGELKKVEKSAGINIKKHNGKRPTKKKR
jgi:hypothetical protein